MTDRSTSGRSADNGCSMSKLHVHSDQECAVFEGPFNHELRQKVRYAGLDVSLAKDLFA